MCPSFHLDPELEGTTTSLKYLTLEFSAMRIVSDFEPDENMFFKSYRKNVRQKKKNEHRVYFTETYINTHIGNSF